MQRAVWKCAEGVDGAAGLAHAPSNRPFSDSTLLKSASTAAGSQRSVGHTSAGAPPSCAIIAAVSTRGASLLPVSTREAPARASASADARPMPEPEPVTSATLPSRGAATDAIAVLVRDVFPWCSIGGLWRREISGAVLNKFWFVWVALPGLYNNFIVSDPPWKVYPVRASFAWEASTRLWREARDGYLRARPARFMDRPPKQLPKQHVDGQGRTPSRCRRRATGALQRNSGCAGVTRDAGVPCWDG